MAEYDLVIRNGTIVDGTRLPAYRGDVGIRNGRIVAIDDRYVVRVWNVYENTVALFLQSESFGMTGEFD